MISLARARLRVPSGLLLVITLTLVSACGSRSSLVERSALADGGGSGGTVVGSGGSVGAGGSATGSATGSGGRPGSGGVSTGGVGGSVGTGGVSTGGVSTGGVSTGGVSTGGTGWACTDPSCCGDGFLKDGEDCDDGNTSGGDACPADCSFEVLQVTLSSTHFACALLSNDRIKCWGARSWGQLGFDDGEDWGDEPDEMGPLLPFVELGGRTARQVEAGDHYHACALFDDGAVKCWGRNISGPLGLGDIETRGDHANEMGDALPTVLLGTGRTAKGLGAGVMDTCALLDDGLVKCWGLNLGQLGLGDVADRGDQPNEMGDALPTVLLGSGRSAKALAVGSYHTCVLLDDETVKCWGQNSSGQLGLGDADTRGDDANELGDALPAVDLGTGRTAKALAAGFEATCALLDDGSVKCWGANGSGQLGLGDVDNRGDGPNEMGDALPAVDLGTGRSARMLAVGSGHACALLDDDTLKCWGENGDGQLGLGDVEWRGDAGNEMGDALPVVDLGPSFLPTALAAGGFRTCALESGGSVKCWGSNYRGALGLGDTETRGDGPNEMGAALPAIDLW